jgi:ectoine hydroxylase-related dioxygenase (phytanoyl-CoA dioxygenase family)
MHSGGWKRRQRTQFDYQNGDFHCGMINMLTALNDIGPGDGATTVVPGTHKSNLQHPEVSWPVLDETNEPAKHVGGMIEIHLQAGDTLLFVDSLCHGAVARTNAGQRRIVVYRYGPGWSNTRLGYRYSDNLIARLTPTRRKILQPVALRNPE